MESIHYNIVSAASKSLSNVSNLADVSAEWPINENHPGVIAFRALWEASEESFPSHPIIQSAGGMTMTELGYASVPPIALYPKYKAKDAIPTSSFACFYVFQVMAATWGIPERFKKIDVKKIYIPSVPESLIRLMESDQSGSGKKNEGLKNREVIKFIEMMNSLTQDEESQNEAGATEGSKNNLSSVDLQKLVGIAFCLRYLKSSRKLGEVHGATRIQEISDDRRNMLLQLFGPLKMPSAVMFDDGIGGNFYQKLASEGLLFFHDAQPYIHPDIFQMTECEVREKITAILNGAEELEGGKEDQAKSHQLIAAIMGLHRAHYLVSITHAENINLPIVDISPEKPLQVLTQGPGSGKTVCMHVIRTVLAAHIAGQGIAVGNGSQIQHLAGVIDGVTPTYEQPEGPKLSGCQRFLKGICTLLRSDGKGQVLIADDQQGASSHVIVAIIHALGKYLKILGDRAAIIATHASPALGKDMNDEQMRKLLRALKEVDRVSAEVLENEEVHDRTIRMKPITEETQTPVDILRMYGAPQDFIDMVEELIEVN